MPYHIYLVSYRYADIAIYEEAKATGYGVAIVAVFLVGTLRKNRDAIKETHLKLDRLVETRNKELDLLASKLIFRSEEIRVALGQELHDGIGQYLTGIKLYSASLADRLHETESPHASLSDDLVKVISDIHDNIRQIARMLFPVRIGQVGLIPALNEMAACFQELLNVEFTIEETNSFPEFPEQTALELYRIIQETAHYAIDHLKANRIAIRLSVSDERTCQLEFAHNGLPLRFEEHSNSLRLLEYRLTRISGRSERTPFDQGWNKTAFIIPIPDREALLC